MILFREHLLSGDLIMEGHQTLARFPVKRVRGSLSLEGSTVRELCEGLTVNGFVFLGECASLTSLPKGMTVGANLWLDRCPEIKSLPADLVVGGEVLFG